MMKVTRFHQCHAQKLTRMILKGTFVSKEKYVMVTYRIKLFPISPRSFVQRLCEYKRPGGIPYSDQKTVSSAADIADASNAVVCVSFANKQQRVQYF